MKNKKVGSLILGIGVAVTTIILIFNYSIRKLSNIACNYRSQCIMNSTLNSQLFLSFAIVGIIFTTGLYIMFSKPEEKVVIKKIIEKPKKKKLNLTDLTKNEKKAIEEIQKKNGIIFQAELKEKLEIGKVSMTRLLNKLELKEIIERKRKGMNNLVVLKE
ncbi:MAG: hypothetical protein U9Q99_03125 [Nanoarchaeota archaeon]|nr:hypothetical protein [Nanoarchaeota archaeon]